MLELGGEQFALTDKAPGGLIYKIGEAESRGDVGLMLRRYMSLMRRIVVDDDRDRLEKFIESDTFDDLDVEEIGEAITTAVAEVMRRPTVRPSNSDSGPQPTAPTSRVVSLSPATRQTETSQTA